MNSEHPVESSTPSLQPAVIEPQSAQANSRPSVAAAGALGALLGALLVLVWSESSPRQHTGAASPAEPAPLVAEREAFAAVGTVELDPDHTANISTQDPGSVHRVATFEGDHVEKGALLAVIEMERDTPSSATAREAAARYQLVAPIAGTVVERSLSLTQQVGAESPAFRVANLDHLQINVRVPESVLGGLREGDRVDVQPFAAQELTVPGRVTAVKPLAGELDARVSVHVADRERHLRIGQGVRVRAFAGTSR